VTLKVDTQDPRRLRVEAVDQGDERSTRVRFEIDRAGDRADVAA
jgi:hypothetical protein